MWGSRFSHREFCAFLSFPTQPYPGTAVRSVKGCRTSCTDNMGASWVKRFEHLKSEPHRTALRTFWAMPCQTMPLAKRVKVAQNAQCDNLEPTNEHFIIQASTADFNIKAIHRMGPQQITTPSLQILLPVALTACRLSLSANHN